MWRRGTNFKFDQNFLSTNPKKSHERKIQMNLIVENFNIFLCTHIFNKLKIE